MRQRFQLRRPRSMARRTGEGGRVALSPRARLIAGWVVALLLVLGIAGAVRLLGESADQGAVAPSPSSGSAGPLLPIVFGTELSTERVVPVEARTATFERGMTFAYAVDGGEPAAEVYVEVERTDGGRLEPVQEPVDAQPIPDAPALIGFTVPTAVLLDAWGPGAYVMRIYLEPDGAPIAEGGFVLVEAAETPP
jgi:hypothetical protein